MGLLGKIFARNKSNNSLPKGFHEAKVKEIQALTKNSVKITFDKESLPLAFKTFTPGQYINILVHLDGQEYRRSYSICSSESEGISIGVKKLENGKVSQFLTSSLKQGDVLAISQPEGQFKLDFEAKNVVFIAAGSGITPILSMMKSCGDHEISGTLLYANRKEDEVMFKEDILKDDQTSKHLFLTQENKDGFQHGRLDTEGLKNFFKNNLPLLRSDAFYICGPEAMIKGAIDALNFYGVSPEKVRFELFTEAQLLKKESPKSENDFSGDAHVFVTLDGMETDFTLNSKKESLLEATLKQGLDAPYSCKGGVCSTCRAKVTEGSARMNNNLTLTDKEVEEGYILTCQSHPTSETLKITYDE